MRVLVCGSRHSDDVHLVFETLDALHARRPISFLIERGATGADKYAAAWADQANVRSQAFRAEWMRYGADAETIRDQQVIEQGSPDLVVAFPGGRGTADMVRRARAASIEVIEVTPSQVSAA